MSENDSQNTDGRQEGAATFQRGSPLSVFSSDRREDLMALAIALVIALGVYVLVGG
jgi:hypothetical protein